eukprot:TRINITY_DN5873_c2_g1_i1.p1 TRINITY_DN5873_c2_g1~~TRINITY_DN5873_c2_g1_i1.p1  ORF type:complete len:513 (+),score=125.84 TRINITY_DN5873_c2_g1_i1:92-1630(+)
MSVGTLLLAFATAASGASGRPNLLLLFPDQWRYDWDGLHGELNTGKLPLNTPFLRQMATEGTRFTQAYVPAPVCSPSRSCLASGREYDEAGVPDNFGHDYPVSQTTFYSLLRESGYHTITTGKDDLTKATQLGSLVNYSGCSYCVAGDGRYHQEELGFSDGLRYSGKADVVDTDDPHEMYGYFLRNHTMHLANGTEVTGWDAHRACMNRGSPDLCTNTTYTEELYEDHFTAANAVELLKRKPQGKPWMMHVSFPGPHPPFLVTGPMFDSVADRVWPEPTDYPEGVPQTCQATGEPNNTLNRCNYAAEIENLDALFRMVISTVEEMGELDNTIVCVSSDHGEMLEDHGDTGKSVPWQGSASVPLLCKGPGIRQNATVARPVATLDIAATFLDYAGVAPAENMTAVSLRPLLEGGESAPYKDVISSGLKNWRMVVKETSSDNGTSGSFKYICCKDACPGAPSTSPPPVDGWTQMLIDVTRDEFDMVDLTPSNPKLVASLRPLLPLEYANGCAGI